MKETHKVNILLLDSDIGVQTKVNYTISVTTDDIKVILFIKNFGG